eukprot:697301-Prymnesium_polylepis.3
MYRLALKIAVLKDTREPTRSKLRGHLITFAQDGVDKTCMTLRQACAWAREAFSVAFVGPKEDYDLIKARLAYLGPLRARVDVVRNWMAVRARVAAVYDPDATMVEPPGYDEMQVMLDELRRDGVMDDALIMEDTSIDEEQSRRSADIAETRNPTCLLPDLLGGGGGEQQAESSRPPVVDGHDRISRVAVFSTDGEAGEPPIAEQLRVSYAMPSW